MAVALAVLVVGAVGITISLCIERFTENREENKKDDSNSR